MDEFRISQTLRTASLQVVRALGFWLVERLSAIHFHFRFHFHFLCGTGLSRLPQAAFTDPNLTRDRLFGLANDFIQSVENGTHTQRG